MFCGCLDVLSVMLGAIAMGTVVATELAEMGTEDTPEDVEN